MLHRAGDLLLLCVDPRGDSIDVHQNPCRAIRASIPCSAVSDRVRRVEGGSLLGNPGRQFSGCIADFFKRVMDQDSERAHKCHDFLAQLGGTDNTSPHGQ
jgi:hypothetical protein